MSLVESLWDISTPVSVWIAQVAETNKGILEAISVVLQNPGVLGLKAFLTKCSALPLNRKISFLQWRGNELLKCDRH